MSELYHHGILGQKWGVRRTPEQLGHVTSTGEKKTSSGESRSEASSETKKSKFFSSKSNTETTTKDDSEEKSKKKTLSDLSEEELRDKIQRLQLEKQYKELLQSTTAKTVKSNDSKAKEFVMDVLEKSGKNIATQATAYAMGTIVNNIYKNISGSNENIVDPKNIQKKK